MVRIAVICGSTRPNRNGEAVAKWAYETARKRDDAEFEYIDLKEVDLPLLDEPIPPSQGMYQNEHTKQWAGRIAKFDGFVFVTPEYNHGTSAALKNAIDYLFAEWNDKACGFVGYGSAGGVRAIENLRLVMGEIKIADVRTHVAFSLFEDFKDYTKFQPRDFHENTMDAMLDELVAWSTALRSMRQERMAAREQREATTGSQRVASKDV